MSIILNKDLVENLVEGSAVYSCGGGIEKKINRKKCLELVKRKKITLAYFDDFRKNDLLGVISGIGKPSQKKYNFKEAVKAGVEYISSIMPGKKIKGVVPGEIGIESLVMEMAGELSLPILDGDAVGGRAVPEIQDDIFYIDKISTTPAICVNLNKEIIVIDKTRDLEKIENIVRNFSVVSNGPVILIDHINYKYNFEGISLGTFSRSIELGEKIKNKKGEESLKEILSFNNAKIIAEGKIVSVAEGKHEGFLEKIIKSKNWYVIAKNEYLAVFINRQLISAIPDIIVMIDKKSGKPLHNTFIKEGNEVWVIAMKGFKKWYTKRGLKIFGPSSIGYINQ